MAKKDPPRDPNERTSVDPAKLPKHVREKIDNEFPRAVAIALYAGCNEFDFMRSAELLMRATERGLQGMPLTEESVEAIQCITDAHTRLRESMFHMSQFNKTMQLLHELVEKHGVVTPATVEEAERLARGKLKT